jgi:hypothetical protein
MVSGLVLAKLTCTRERLARLWRGESLGRHERVRKRDLQIELLLLARKSVVDAGKKVNPLAELCHRFAHRAIDCWPTVLPRNLVRDSRLIEGPRGRVGALRIIGF